MDINLIEKQNQIINSKKLGIFSDYFARFNSPFSPLFLSWHLSVKIYTKVL